MISALIDPCYSREGSNVSLSDVATNIIIGIPHSDYSQPNILLVDIGEQHHHLQNTARAPVLSRTLQAELYQQA